jgi:hypothetical protein
MSDGVRSPLALTVPDIFPARASVKQDMNMTAEIMKKILVGFNLDYASFNTLVIQATGPIFCCPLIPPLLTTRCS